MFDAETAALIRSIPTFNETDPRDLPQRLTRMYARILEARVRHSEGSSNLREELDAILAIARACEALVATSSHTERQRACSFVAASAYQFLGIADVALPSAALSSFAVGYDLASALLFLNAGYIADAIEASARFKAAPETEPEVAELISRLSAIIRGDLVSASAPVQDFPRPRDFREAALQALWLRLVRAVVSLAASLLGQEVSDPLAEFLAVEDAARFEFEVGGSRTVSSFSAPHHLAVLLRFSGMSLLGSSLVRHPPPSGVDAVAWKRFVRGLARRRPYLWTNHVDALSRGILDVGASCVASFPTGAGKSTLSELKVASALLAGRKVVFLVPTHALVRQVADSLASLFPNRVGSSFVLDGYYAEVDRPRPDIAVLTPERCLTLIGGDPESFAEVGLIVFDECHLLHGDEDPSERSIDAMVCLLQLLDVAPSADLLLLSAMLANAGELSLWLAELTGRKVVALESTWKPTRQARGCVCYAKGELVTAHKGAQMPGAKPSAAPHALFSLEQHWSSSSMSNYHLVRLLDEEVPLTVAKPKRGARYLTPNRNVVAGRLARAFADSGIKTLVFAQQRGFCSTIANEVAVGTETPAMTEEEEALLAISVEEVGDLAHVYRPVGIAAVHHGMLIPSERRLSERMFERPDGLRVLAATPTLAQGMNLPAEAVILSGDDRHDGTTQQAVPAHELLNAAGRAGRAGLRAQGIALVLPGEVLGFDLVNGLPDGTWQQVRALFEQADQCLTIVDPITRVLDRLALTNQIDSPSALHLLLRLPLDDGDAAARRLLSRSLAAFHAQKSRAAFDAKIDRALALRVGAAPRDTKVEWYDLVAARCSVPASLVRSFDELLAAKWDDLIHASPEDLIQELVAWFARSKDDWDWFLYLTDMRETKFEVVRTPAGAATLVEACRLWMNAASLVELEARLPALVNSKRTGAHCDHARHFVLRDVPSIAYVLGIAGMVARHRVSSANGTLTMPLALATFAACLKEGVINAGMLAVRYQVEGGSRLRCRRAYEDLEPDLPNFASDAPFSEVLKAVRDAA